LPAIKGATAANPTAGLASSPPIMIEAIRRFLGLCTHKWEVLNKYDVVNESGKNVGDLYILRCERCGQLKQRKFIA